MGFTFGETLSLEGVFCVTAISLLKLELRAAPALGAAPLFLPSRRHTIQVAVRCVLRDFLCRLVSLAVSYVP
jgi:hypothetical protein